MNQARDENKEKYQLRDYMLIQFQTLQSNIISIISQTVRRFSNEIMGVKESNHNYFDLAQCSLLYQGTCTKVCFHSS